MNRCVGIERGVGAEPLGLGPPQRGGFGGDDRVHAVPVQRRHDAEPDRPAAEHDGDGSGLDLRAAHRDLADRERLGQCRGHRIGAVGQVQADGGVEHHPLAVAAREVVGIADGPHRPVGPR